MATQTKPIVHNFKEINDGKYKSVRHYELTSVSNGTTQLSNVLNISVNRNCALSMPVFWLKIREGKKWSKCITGLFKTTRENIFKGDVNRRTHLLVFRFSDNYGILKVYYFKNYFTKDLNKIKHLLRE